ncbi:unnamed protein product [Gadus morhua 'NCC']
MPRATAAWQVNRMSCESCASESSSVSSSTQFQTRPDQTLGSDQFCPRSCETRRQTNIFHHAESDNSVFRNEDVSRLNELVDEV